jgi:hypothetical protein
MALQDPLIRLGWLTLSTLDDARNSTVTGTTLNGPQGSGQFYWVYTSTLNSLQCRLGSSGITPSSLVSVIGILQNKPGPGEAADIGFLGISKAIAGSTSLTMGNLIQPSSAPTGQSGELVVFASGNGPPIGYALEAPTSTGALFTVMVNASGARGSTIT